MFDRNVINYVEFRMNVKDGTDKPLALLIVVFRLDVL